MKRHLILIIIVLFSVQCIFTQTTETIKIKKINGTEFYVYNVQSGDGLFGISRKFNVNQNDILKSNPDAANGLKNGQELLIPINSNNKSLKSATQTNINQVNYIEHKVIKGQTIFGIAKKYNISQEEIKKENPELESGLKEGMILKIPSEPIIKQTNEKLTKTENLHSTTQTPDIQSNKISYSDKKPDINATKDKYAIHTVQPKETLYSISRLYNLDIAEIVKMNPDCDKLIKTGTELKIPYSERTVVKSDTITTNFKENKENSELTLTSKIKPNSEPIRIAFLLPFMLENQKPDNATEKFVEFYSGALVAIEDAKKLGISFEIYTFDTEKSEQKITEILQKDVLRNVDIVIGPAYSNQIPIISEFALKNQINTVIPFSSKVYNIDSNPFLFQFNPRTDVKIDFVSNLISKFYKFSNISFINIPDANVLDENNSFTDGLKTNLDKLKINYNDINVNNPENFDITKTLRLNHENLVFFNTEKFSLAQPYMQKIASSDDYQVIFYNELNWQNQENSFKNSFAVSPFRNKLNDLKLKKYDKSFKNHFNWTISSGLPRYDLLGYDLTNYFLTQIFFTGSNFTIDRVKLQEMSGIQSYFKFKRDIKNSGFINEQLNLLDFDNPK